MVKFRSFFILFCSFHFCKKKTSFFFNFDCFPHYLDQNYDFLYFLLIRYVVVQQIRIQIIMSSGALGLLYVSLAYAASYYLGHAGTKYACGQYITCESGLGYMFICNMIATTVICISGFIVGNRSVYDPYWSVAPLPTMMYWVAQHDGANISARSSCVKSKSEET